MRLSKSANTQHAAKTLPIVVTMGDVKGIGGELTLKAWHARKRANLPCFYAIDDPDRLTALAHEIGVSVPVKVIDDPPDAASVFETALPVSAIDAPGSELEMTLASIDRAVEHVFGGQAKAVVTNPIHKKALYDIGFEFQGHTDYLEHLAESLTNTCFKSVMMLASRQLRTVPLTVHVPLQSVPDLLSQELIVDTAEIVLRALSEDFGVETPRLAVTGLNPHAGENGGLGREDLDIIAPAIETLKKRGYSVTGPHSADTLFHDKARRTYDAALCMYHDQALIPIKTLDFDQGVNVSLGLPFIRTSPDHGTARDIAGTGTANPTSFMEALRLADTLANNRARSSTAPR